MGTARFLECRFVATTNTPEVSLGGLPTIDGQPVRRGSWVLLVGQTTKAENGVWIVRERAPWRRPNEASTKQDFLGMTVVVRRGDELADTTWQCVTDGDITIGTTDLEFVLIEHAKCLETVADLRAFTPGASRCVTVLGYHVPGDGGGGHFYSDASTEPDNGGTVFVPDSGPGRWRRLVEGPLSVKWFGALGDGNTHPLGDFYASLQEAQAVYPHATRLGQELDWAAIQAAFNVVGVASGRRVVFPDGVYVAYALKVRANTTIDLGAATLKKRPASHHDPTLQEFTGNSTVFWSQDPRIMAPLLYITGDNVVVENGTIDGDREAEDYEIGRWGGAFAVEGNRCGILASESAEGVTNLTVRSVRFANMYGSAIVTEYLTDGLWVTDCVEENAGSIFLVTASQWEDPWGHAGEAVISGNTLRGARANNNVANPLVLDGFERATFVGNIIVGDGPESGGCKFQNIVSLTISGNSFDKEYVKAQARPDFLGDSLVVASNTFTSATPYTHRTGVSMAVARYKSVTVDGNALVNGNISVERSCDVITISGNSIRIDRDARERAAVDADAPFFAVGGGANIDGVSGAGAISGNQIDLGGFAMHCFWQGPARIGQNTIQSNVVRGADVLMQLLQSDITGAEDHAIEIADNVFTDYRAVGLFDIIRLGDFVVKGNVFQDVNMAEPSDIITGTAARSLYVSMFQEDTVIDRFLVQGNYWDVAAEPGPAFGVYVGTSRTEISSVTVDGNYIKVSETDLWAWGVFGTGCTVDDLVVTNNYSNKRVSLIEPSVVTERAIANNLFPDGIGSPIQGTTKQAIWINGNKATTVGAAGSAAPLPTNPVGYVEIEVDGTTYRVPFYNAS